MKFIKEIIPYIIVVLVAILMRTFIVTPVQVDGESMYPTLDDNQILLLKKYDNLLSIGITVDGCKECHDACRVFHNGEGSYDKAFAAAKHNLKYIFNSSFVELSKK